MSKAMGKVWLVGAGPGDPELITWRGRELLGRAEVVLYDALSHPDLLELCPQAELRDVGKRYGQRATPQGEITSQLIELARSGKAVVRLKGGDPLMFARGSEEALALAEAQVPFEIVPGVTSPIAASAYAGISLTHRDASSSVTFITGSDREGKEWSPEAWKKLATATGTICVYMGMRRIAEITQAVIDGGRDPGTPAAVVRWGARPKQRTVVGTLSDIAERATSAGLGSPAVIIIGEVVALRDKMRWYDTSPLFGRRILVARPKDQARATAAIIRQRAATPVVCPAIVIRPVADPTQLRASVLAAHSYDWVIFTSQNGVQEFFSQVDALGKDARVFGAAKVAVIGPKTGEALRLRGIVADFCAEKFVAESLVEGLLALPGSLQRVLIPRAKEARELLPEALRARGALVDVVVAYETLPATGALAEALRSAIESECDAVLFTSSSMVDAVCAVLGATAASQLNERVVVCIGPVTRDTALSHGLKVDVEAEVFTVDGALDALAAYYAGRDAGGPALRS